MHCSLWTMSVCVCVFLKGDDAVHGSLLLDGESVYSLVANPLLLLLARIILAKCCEHMSHLQVRKLLLQLRLRSRRPANCCGYRFSAARRLRSHTSIRTKPVTLGLQLTIVFVFFLLDKNCF